MSAPTPARSEMVEKVAAKLRQQAGFRLDELDEREISRFNARAAALIAAVLDNLPRRTWAKLIIDWRDNRPAEIGPHKLIARMIEAARLSVLGHE